MSTIKKLKQIHKDNEKSSVIAYFILRFLVVICLIRQLMLKNYESALLCVLSLILLILPALIQKKFKIKLPSALEITIYLFIFAAEILGEIYNFYGNIPNWDLILHTTNGFLCAGIGLSLINLLNENSKKVDLSPLYLTIVAFCFSMTIGVLWEFGEYTVDKILILDTQKDTIVNKISSVNLNSNNENKVVVVKNIAKTALYNETDEELITIEGGYLDIGLHDTIEDLFVNFIGAIIYSVYGYFYIKNQNKKNIASKFLITKES